MYIVHVRETIETVFTVDCGTEDQARSIVMQYIDGQYMDSGPFIDKEEVYTSAVDIISVRKDSNENKSP